MACLVNEEFDKDDMNCKTDSHFLAFRESQNNLDESLPFRGSDTAVKTLPSYESLKKETETFNLRIREFYRGQYVLNEDTTISQDSEEVCLDEFWGFLAFGKLIINKSWSRNMYIKC